MFKKGKHSVVWLDLGARVVGICGREPLCSRSLYPSDVKGQWRGGQETERPSSVNGFCEDAQSFNDF